jgi:hypothetical protein
MNNRWARLSSIEYVNPNLGKVVFNGDAWMAHPRCHLDISPKPFTTLKEAITWLEDL